MTNTFSKIPSMTYAGETQYTLRDATDVARAFAASNTADELFACLRFLARMRGKSGEWFTRLLDGSVFLHHSHDYLGDILGSYASPTRARKIFDEYRDEARAFLGE